MSQRFVDTVQSKIRSGEVQMRSRLSVWAEKLGLGSSIVLVTLMMVFLAGAVLYWFYTNTDLMTMSYQGKGIWVIVESFPYILLVGFVLFFLILSILLRRYDFSYKRSFIGMLALVIVLTLGAGWVSAQQSSIQDLYKHQVQQWGRRVGSNFLLGTVMEVNKSSLVLETEQGYQIVVTLSQETHYPFGLPGEGDFVRTVGRWDDDTFAAEGVRVFDEESPAPGQGMGPGNGKRDGSGEGRGRMHDR